MMIQKFFTAETAHRLAYSYTKRCRGLHGHSYKFTLTLQSTTQNQAQMLMDFKELTEKVHSFLDAFDHSILIWKEDSELLKLAPQLNTRYIVVPYNTTAEQIARHIFFQLDQWKLPIKQVQVHETSKACAIFENDDPISFDLQEVYYSEKIRSEWVTKSNEANEIKGSNENL